VFIVDIAVPRDFDPRCASVNNCFLYDIDDLKQVVENNVRKRRREIGSVERIVEESVLRFQRWMSALEVVPVLTRFRELLHEIREKELEKYSSKLNSLPEEERELIEKITHGIVNKILHAPTTRLKQLTGERNGASHAETLTALFDLGEPEEGK
ncbi:MAG: glutamyl-tRNA reductase, partial [bacterium]